MSDNIEVPDAASTEESLLTPSEVVVEDTTPEANEGSWNDFVLTLDEDIQDNKAWEKFNSTQELAKSYTELSTLVGKKGEIPKDDASGEEWADFYSKLGRPESPEDYGISIREGLEAGEDRLNDGLKLAHELGISKKQAESLFNGLMDRELTDSQGISEQLQLNRDSETAKLSDTWGNGMNDMIDTVTRLEKSLGVYEAFEAKGLNADADLLIMMGELSKRLGEDPEINAGMAKTPAGLDDSISEVNTDIKEYLKRGEKVPQHLVNKRAELFDNKYK